MTNRKPDLVNRKILVLACLTLVACAEEVAPDELVAELGPAQRHVYLHYDYMVATDHSHAPDPAAIEMVVEEYRRNDIVLHIDPQHDAIPERRVLAFDPLPSPFCLGPDWASMSDLKAQYFDPAQPNRVYHYAVFGHSAWCGSIETCVCASPYGTLGYSNGIGATDFFVTLGVLLDEGVPFEPATEAGVFMHELGHNLGLRHGGDQDLDFKPNYLSVMNNAFIAGISFAATPGSLEPVGLRVGYSGAALAPLDEANLDEGAGIGAGTTDLTFYFCVDETLPPEEQFLEGRFGAATGPIDWSCSNTSIDTGVVEDINSDGALGLLTGHEDWNVVRAYLDSEGGPGTPRHAPPQPEPGFRRHD